MDFQLSGSLCVCAHLSFASRVQAPARAQLHTIQPIVLQADTHPARHLLAVFKPCSCCPSSSVRPVFRPGPPGPPEFARRPLSFATRHEPAIICRSTGIHTVDPALLMRIKTVVHLTLFLWLLLGAPS